MIFILGRTPELSVAELAAVLPSAQCTTIGPHLVSTAVEIGDPAAVLARLGGTVKIAVPVAARCTPQAVADDIAARRVDKERMLFGLSWFSRGKGLVINNLAPSHPIVRPSRAAAQSQNPRRSPATPAVSLNRRDAIWPNPGRDIPTYLLPGPNVTKRLALGLTIKKLLKTKGLASRLVTSRADQLPAAAINRHGAIEYLVLPDGSLARTVAAQDVDDFTRRDVGRPHRDLRSGTLPPKIARIMVNLARVPAGGTLLDPFCGSGTVLTEALLSGVTSVIGSDVSAKAVAESQANLRWLQGQYPAVAPAQWQVFVADARQLGKTLGRQQVAAIVTEPYLGPPRRGRETRTQLAAVIRELSDLYQAAFVQFEQVLKPGGSVVIALPEFVLGREILPVPISEEIKRLGFRFIGGPYPYHRPDQHVRRSISVWARK